MNNDAPIPEERLRSAFNALPKGSLSADFQQRALAGLARSGRRGAGRLRTAVLGCAVAIPAALVMVMASIDWAALEPSTTSTIAAGGGLLLCVAALVFLLRVARGRLMEIFWCSLID